MQLIENRMIYIDGQYIDVDCHTEKGFLMVPALFFKHAGIFVDVNLNENSVILKKDKSVLVLYKDQYESSYFAEGSDHFQHDSLLAAPREANGTLFIPFYYVAQRLGFLIWNNFENSTIYLLANLSPVLKYHKGEINKKAVALTFDDGPDKEDTPKILDILREKNVPSTFFVVGQQVNYSHDILKRIMEEGHSIGNHSWSHPNFAQITTSQLMEEIQKTEQEIISVTGKRTTILRPPYGSYTNADARLFDELGYMVILWSIDTLDWAGIPEEQILSIIARDVTPGAIILMHSIKTGKPSATVKALPLIIDHLKAEGYEFVTVNDLL